MPQPISTLQQKTRDLLDQVYDLFGKDNVTVTSTTRSAAKNASIKGASNTSQHLDGGAFDFVVAGMTPVQVQQKIADSSLIYGQSIQEYGAGMGPRNHLSIPRGTILMKNTIGINGKYSPSNILVGVKKKINDFLTGSKLLVNDPGKFTNVLTKDVLGIDIQSYIFRGGLAIIGIILLAAAITSLSKQSVVNSIKG
jgi:hypothetical protein